TWEELCEAREWVLGTLSQALGPRAPNPEALVYCIESTAAYHYPVMICWAGYPCVVNPLLAHAGRRKTDKLDARGLAHQALTGTWKPSYVAPVEVEICRLALNHRRRLVSERSRLTNSMNNLVLRFGHTFAAHRETALHTAGALYDAATLPIFEALAEGKLPNVRGVAPHKIPEETRVVMKEIIDRVNELNRAVKVQGDRLVRLVAKTEFVRKGGELVAGDDVVRHQKTIPGVGPLLSAVWLSQVGDATRFAVAKQVQAFCGFDPSLMVSAGKVTSHSRRKGHVFLHYMIKQVSKTVINSRREPLGLWGYAISRRHRSGGYNKAVGAVGRRISTALWICHRDLVDFSYDSYQFWRAPEVPDVAIQEVGFSQQVLRIMAEHGFTKTRELVAAYAAGELAQRKGVGARCLAQLNQWIAKNRKERREESTSAAPSSGEAKSSSEKTKPKS
ncbi:MAG: transposase, partial [Pirellulales bacterium]